VFATGAGSASRHSLGTPVFGGMIVSTILNLVLVPVIYVLISRIRDRVGPHHPHEPPPPDDRTHGESPGLATANI
jgi:hypothetical protein